MKFSNNSVSFLLLLYSCPWLYKKKHPWQLKEKNPWVWQSWSQLNIASESPAELCKHRIGCDTVEVLIQFVFSSAMEFVFLTWSQLIVMMLVNELYFEKSWSRVNLLFCLGKYSETEYLVSAPQHFWISFQGEPEPPCSLGGPSSLCHCPQTQENPSSGCPSLPDTTWGFGSGQG